MRHKLKHIVELVFIFLVLGTPTFAQAACSSNGYTIVFVNGVFDTKKQADANSLVLQRNLGDDFNGQPINYTVGYNQTHVAGLGDLAEVAFPSLNQLDLDTILRQIHDDVHTRKLLIVGHSQGSVYANKIYDYLITHGEPKDAVALYAVATPEPIPPSKGKYLNFEGDDTIYGPLASKVIHPPPFNISSSFYWTSTTTDGGSYQGHGFIDEYLATFPDIITTDIKNQLFVLRPTYASDTLTECFTAPDITTGEKVGSTVLSVTDFYANSVVGIAQQGYGQAAFAVGAGKKVAGVIGNAFGAVAGLFAPKPATADNDRATNNAIFAAVKAIYGSSLDVKDVDQLQRDAQKKKNNNGLGAAAILAFDQDTPAPQGEVLGSSTDATSSPQAEATSTASVATTTPAPAFPTAPTAMAGENVHYNAPTFGGAAAAENTVADPPAPTAAEVFAASPPAVSYSNWRGAPGAQFCQVVTRTVDISWSAVPNATYYELWATGPIPTNVTDFLFATTTATTFPDFSFVNAGPSSSFTTTIWVVARDAAGNSATTTSVISSALADQQGPSVVTFSPAIQATNVATTSSVVLTFNEPLAASTVTDQLFLLYQLVAPSSQTLLSSTVSLSSDGMSVTIFPQQPLLYSTGYRLSFSCAVTDTVGNHPAFDTSIFSNSVDPYFVTEADPAVATSTP